MEEIANQFKEELQELLDRYKTQLSVPRIMGIAQDIFHKTLSVKYHPELHQAAINYFLQSTGYNNHDLHSVQDRIYKGHCSSQEIAEADCDGDIRHCKDACHKIQAKGVKL